MSDATNKQNSKKISTSTPKPTTPEKNSFENTVAQIIASLEQVKAEYAKLPGNSSPKSEFFSNSHNTQNHGADGATKVAALEMLIKKIKGKGSSPEKIINLLQDAIEDTPLVSPDVPPKAFFERTPIPRSVSAIQKCIQKCSALLGETPQLRTKD